MRLDEDRDASLRAVVVGFYEAFADHDLEKLRRVVTEHWEYIPEPKGAELGPDQMAPLFRKMAAALPDMRIEIHDLLIHGNRIGVRAEVSGTQRGPLMGIEATSKPVRFAIHSFHEVKQDRIAKTWHLEDWLSVFHQIGELPQELDLRG